MKARIAGPLFTIVGTLYIGSPALEAFDLIPHTPEDPPLSASAASTATDTGAATAYDTIGDHPIDVRPQVVIVAPLQDT